MNLSSNLESAQSKQSKPWYRYPMVWMVIIIPFSAVVVGGILLTLAITSFDGLVEDDYYQKGKEINQLLARDEFAVQNTIVANVQVDMVLGSITIDLSNRTAYEFPEQMDLSLLHPTQAKRDVKLLLKKAPDGRYHAQLLNPLSDGRWYFRISEPNWRLQKLIMWPLSSAIEISSDSG